MLLELADYYPILFLLPFIALHVVWRARAYKAPAGWKTRALIVTAQDSSAPESRRPQLPGERADEA